MGSSVWLNLLGSGFAVTIVVTIINALFNRRKLGADTTKVITDAAAGTLKDLREDYARVRQENAELRDAEDEHDELIEAYRNVAILHSAWDHIAQERCTDLPPVPPLTPPTRRPRA